MMMPKKTVLFLCTGNSCRSQMAEAWTRHLHGDIFEAYSAGVEARGVDPLAVRVMGEVRVDISSQRSKHLDSLGDMAFDYVITLCGHAAEACPYFPATTRVLHVPFDDPPSLTAGWSDEEKVLDQYRRVRDEVRAFVERLDENLTEGES
jgi:arsenate reductase (thioredoxin)